MDPSILITDSEYLETHLIVVPANNKKEFLKSYETIAPMVVPRSSVEVAKDEEFVLFAVTTFKKHSSEFLQKCREQKYTPRQYKYVEGGKEEEQKELDRAAREEKKVWGEALRLGRTGWSEAVMVWAHVMTLRVFVETVLRYGLPLEYVSALVKVGLNTTSRGSFWDYAFTNTIYLDRQTPSYPKRSRPHWTLPTPTWEATLSAGTRRARLPRTTLPSARKWQLRVLGSARATSTRPMYTTSLNSLNWRIDMGKDASFSGEVVICMYEQSFLEHLSIKYLASFLLLVLWVSDIANWYHMCQGRKLRADVAADLIYVRVYI